MGHNCVPYLALEPIGRIAATIDHMRLHCFITHRALGQYLVNNESTSLRDDPVVEIE